MRVCVCMRVDNGLVPGTANEAKPYADFLGAG